jgi:hypothetical protein
VSTEEKDRKLENRGAVILSVLMGLGAGIQWGVGIGLMVFAGTLAACAFGLVVARNEWP